MIIKDNIDKEVLSTVSGKLNVSEDLLIKMISSELMNNTILLLSFTFGFLILAVLTAFIAYFQFKKSTSYDNNEFYGNVAATICGVSLLISFAMFVINGAYMKQIEVIFNHEYAVVKEINEIYNSKNEESAENQLQ